LSAAPYLIRLGEWSAAASLLQDAFYRDPSRATAAAVLPQLQTINEAGQVPAAAGALAEVLEVIDPAAAEHQMRAFMKDSVARGDYQMASIAAGRLARQCAVIGQLTEALDLTERKAEYTALAGLGPWTQLLDQVQRLQVLNVMGRSEQVLGEVLRLRAAMEALPAVPDQPEGVTPWNVREELLGTGRDAALRLGRWEDALELNAAIVASGRARGAPATVIAQARFNDYVPLLRLDRIEDALELLLECRRVFERAHDIGALGATLSALAAVENARGHIEVGISLERDALRYKYLAGDADAITSSHRNLGSYLRRSQPAVALTHHLAAALIGALAGAGGTDRSLSEAAIDLRALGAGTQVPSDVAELCNLVAEVPGADLYRLLTSLAAGPDIQYALSQLIARVRALAAAPPPGLSRYLAAWDPVISSLLAAADGQQRAAAALDAELTRAEESTDWSALVAALRRLRDGDTGPELLAGLDDIDTAIMTRAIDARHGKVLIPANLWPSLPFRRLLSNLVAGAGGYTEAIGPARHDLAKLAQDPDSAPLAAVLGRILDGDRAPDLTALTDPTQKAVAETVLQHIVPE
jgi:tetratricopeptide (TPR) repeat protein